MKKEKKHVAQPDFFRASEKLFDIADAFAFTRENEKLFVEAMKECVLHHVKNCSAYRLILEHEGFDPHSITSLRAVEKIPHIFVNTFKERSFSSIKKKDIKLVLTSSGTSGRRTAIILDAISLSRILRIVDHIFTSLGIRSTTPSNYICFTYDPAVAKNIGTAFSDKVLTGLAPAIEIYYALKWDSTINDFRLDMEETIDKFLTFAKTGAPLRVLGFPSFCYRVLTEIVLRTKKSLPLSKKVAPESWILTGGGWKTHSGREIPKVEFKKILAEAMGIPVSNIRDTYGLVEHGIPYVDCEHGNLHIPIYSHAVIRDPGNMKILPDGTGGLLHLYTPYLSSYPSISLLTSDFATLGSRCPCGRRGRYLTILGRGGTKKHKGCAITALKYLGA